MFFLSSIIPSETTFLACNETSPMVAPLLSLSGTLLVSNLEIKINQNQLNFANNFGLISKGEASWLTACLALPCLEWWLVSQLVVISLFVPVRVSLPVTEWPDSRWPRREFSVRRAPAWAGWHVRWCQVMSGDDCPIECRPLFLSRQYFTEFNV